MAKSLFEELGGKYERQGDYTSWKMSGSNT